MYSIGVDIGGSHIAASVYDHNLKKICKETLVHQRVDPHGSKEEIIKGWVKCLQECREAIDVEISGIGIAMPGPFDYYNGISLIQNVDKLNALFEVNIRLELAEKMEIKPINIRFINDATAFSVAEAIIGCANQYKRVVAITLGTGLGASFLKDGKPIISAENVPEGGFLYNQYHGEELADNVFSSRGILSRYKKLSGKQITNVRTLCEHVATDNFAKTTMTEFGQELGAFLKPYLTDFRAEIVVLGGNIAKAYPYFGEALKEKLPNIEIEVSNLGEEAAIIGSALLLNNTYYDAIKPTLKLM